MSAKLLADPKIAALVEKSEDKAAKAERKRILDILKARKDENKDNEDKTEKRLLSFTFQNLATEIKQ